MRPPSSVLARAWGARQQRPLPATPDIISSGTELRLNDDWNRTKGRLHTPLGHLYEARPVVTVHETVTAFAYESRRAPGHLT